MQSNNRQPFSNPRFIENPNLQAMIAPVEDTAYRIHIPPDEAEIPRIMSCQTNQEVHVLPYSSEPSNPAPPRKQVLSILSPQHPCAYDIIPSKPYKDLDHHAPGWGRVYFGIVLPQVDDGMYQEPNPDNVSFVAIKRLNKQVVHQALLQGARENPYIELLRMQTLGDNVHVLGCFDALQDDTFLYMVMPYCEEESLVECIPWRSGSGLEEVQARKYYEQILDNLLYLRSHGICHRDLSPDNCMLYKGRVILTDLAMSFRVPPENDTVQRSSTFGKPAYLPPEVFMQFPFSAFGCDLWSSAVILFNLLTGEVLYELPHFNNILFRYFILARGVANLTLNEHMIEILEDPELDDNQSFNLRRAAQVVLGLNPNYLQLLDGMLQVGPQQRWTAEQVQEYLSRLP